MASLYRLNIQSLKGVGARRAELFRKLGAESVGALLRFYPRAYEDLSSPLPIRTAPSDVLCAVRAIVTQAPKEARLRGGMTLYKSRASDGESTMELTFFNNPYIPSLLKENTEYLFYGKFRPGLSRREMTSPEFFPADSCPPVRPVYRQTEGLSSRMIADAVKKALALLPEAMRDPLPPRLRRQYELCELRYALENIHFPEDMEALALARKRLVFEELLVLQLGLFLMKSADRPENRLRLAKDCTEKFFHLLPFGLTGAQKRAVREAMSDMTGPHPMRRLVQGDVGSGKTAVAAALCHSAVENGLQAALMAPTELLARQHFQTLSGLLEPAGIRVALLTGSLTPVQKRKVREGLASGETGLVIGTHALLSGDVSFRKLGLVVTDEQHRFGVAQRAALTAKGDLPHLLVMSATPIPRTLALTIYGDLDCSVIDELPPGRQKIATYAVTSDKRVRAFGFIRKKLEQGQQCYIVCPSIEEGVNDTASVEEYARRVEAEWLPGFRIGRLHGRMKSREKEEVMERFTEGTIDALVSTTVVEVGVDVPNASVILIENAEHYGLSQLHQLRGRVGRGKIPSACILISDARNPEAEARMKAMCSTSDGFRIADEDLRLRGPGDFFGQRQHGLPELKIADMMTDLEILRQAQEAARQILRDDPELGALPSRGLRAEVNQLFRERND